MTQVQPRNLLAAQPLDGPGRLARPQVATVAEQRADNALARVIELGIEAGQWAEQLMQIQPLLRLGQYVEDADLRH